MFSPSPVSYSASLAWADRMYHHAYPCPVKPNPTTEILDALDAYRAIQAKYGDNAEMHRRLALCLTAQGLYEDALKELPSDSSERPDLEERIAIKATIRRQFGMTACQVLPLPGRTSRSLVIVTNKTPWLMQRKPESELFDSTKRYDATGTALWMVERKDATHLRVIQRKEIDDNNDLDAVHLFVEDLRPGNEKVAIVFQEFFGADNDPTELTFFRLQPKGLKALTSFVGCGGIEVYPHGPSHGLLVQAVATWKVLWPDVYEWERGRFRLANWRHPEAYPIATIRFGVDPSDWDPKSTSAGDWMWHAAELDIHRRFREAAGAWRKAAELLRKEPPYEKGDLEGDTTDSFYGYTHIVLRDIRRRLRWLSHKDYQHWLLYRPYRADLEVDPP